ncbi:MAG: transcriptional regulator [Zoogloea sp.]|nr:transcriptional regulator [Zoogloea sp.]
MGRFENFGRCLAELRKDVGKSQRLAAEELSSGGDIRLGQSMLANYENGGVADPDPKVLLALSRLYKVDYMALVLELCKEKYRLPMQSETDATGVLYEARWNVFKGALRRFDNIGDIDDPSTVQRLEELQLEAKAGLVACEQMLDVRGLATWERELPKAKVFWIAALNYVDNDDKEMEDVVVENLKKSVNYTYFVRPHELKPGSAFANLRVRLEKKAGKQVGQVFGIPVEDEKLKVLNADYAIGNPFDPDGLPVGFQCIRQKGKPIYAFHVERDELFPIIAYLEGFVETAIGSELITTEQAQVLRYGNHQGTKRLREVSAS